MHFFYPFFLVLLTVDYIYYYLLRYEDLRALDGGVDGLRFIKPLIKIAGKLLRHKARLLIEVDPSHPEAIQKWITEKEQAHLRLRYEATHQDFTHKPRFVQLVKMKKA